MTVRETEENIEQIFPELSNLIDIINKWLSHGNIDPDWHTSSFIFLIT